MVQESHSCTILVDGCSINIKYYKNNINFRSIEDIQRLFQNIDEVFAGTKSFGDVCKLIYGKNLLAILDAAYTEKIIGLFEKKYEETIGKSYVSFEDFFNRFFSFPYTRKYSNFQFVAYLKESTSEIASKINIRDRYLSITHNDEFEVKYISTVGNVASFFINGKSFEICLRGRPHLRDCNVVLDTIGVLQAALDGKNRTGVMSVIEQIGNIATLRIMQICYPQLAIDYFISAAEDKIKRRQCIYPNLIPNYQKYNFLLSGFCGSFCHDIVHDQQQYALSQQSNLPDNLKEYLFVSHKGQRLITTKDFNSYLSEFCAKYNIIDALGNPTKVTSHDFRHIAVCERFKSDIISPERTSVECNHASVDDTMGYGYYSKHDEAKHLAQIVSPILPLDSNEQSAPRFVPARKYEILAKQPTTRVIPYYGLCLDRKCSPQFERCFHCDLFIPDPQYREYIAAAIKRLQEANELIAKKHGNETIRQQNLKDIQIFNAYLEKMDAAKGYQKES